MCAHQARDGESHLSSAFTSVFLTLTLQSWFCCLVNVSTCLCTKPVNWFRWLLVPRFLENRIHLLGQTTIISTIFEVGSNQFWVRTSCSTLFSPFIWSFGRLCSPGVTLLSAEERPQPSRSDTARLWQWHNVLPRESDTERMGAKVRDRETDEEKGTYGPAVRGWLLAAEHRNAICSPQTTQLWNSQIAARPGVKCWWSSSSWWPGSSELLSAGYFLNQLLLNWLQFGKLVNQLSFSTV